MILNVCRPRCSFSWLISISSCGSFSVVLRFLPQLLLQQKSYLFFFDINLINICKYLALADNEILQRIENAVSFESMIIVLCTSLQRWKQDLWNQLQFKYEVFSFETILLSNGAAQYNWTYIFHRAFVSEVELLKWLTAFCVHICFTGSIFLVVVLAQQLGLFLTRPCSELENGVSLVTID